MSWNDPGLSSRYGDWGWPATIVLAADGSEIVKRRGYIPPDQMASLLQAITDDPSPGPSVRPPVVIASRGGSRLNARERAALTETYDQSNPADYLQVDWWDRDEGRLPNPEIQYPSLDRAAAFACTQTACSMPVYDAADIEPAVRRALAP